MLKKYKNLRTGRTYSLARTSAQFATLIHQTGGIKTVSLADLVDESKWAEA